MNARLSQEVEALRRAREAATEEHGVCVHGQNIKGKVNDHRKYRDPASKKYLAEIAKRYGAWKSANTNLVGPGREDTDGDKKTISMRVRLFSEYKDFIDQQHYAENFDSRSNLHSSVLEEFIYYLFRDLIGEFEGKPLIGKSHAFKDIFFAPSTFQDMVRRPALRVEKKDHDFVIGVSIKAEFMCAGSLAVENDYFEVPAVAIECKTYLDKTMLEASSTAAGATQV